MASEKSGPSEIWSTARKLRISAPHILLRETLRLTRRDGQASELQVPPCAPSSSNSPRTGAVEDGSSCGLTSWFPDYRGRLPHCLYLPGCAVTFSCLSRGDEDQEATASYMPSETFEKAESEDSHKIYTGVHPLFIVKTRI